MSQSRPCSRANTRCTSASKDRRHALRPLGAGDRLQPRQLDAEHLAIEEQQCRQRLVLRTRRHVARDGQVREECLDFGPAHVARMALVVEQDEPAYPADVRSFGASAVMFRPDAVANGVEQAGRGRDRRASRAVPCAGIRRCYRGRSEAVTHTVTAKVRYAGSSARHACGGIGKPLESSGKSDCPQQEIAEILPQHPSRGVHIELGLADELRNRRRNRASELFCG
jgi:hypothetical protein